MANFPEGTRVVRQDKIGGVIIGIDRTGTKKRTHIVWWDNGKRSRVTTKGLRLEEPNDHRSEEVGSGGS
jgi:hypothetical protein